jgi:hypothetical protein
MATGQLSHTHNESFEVTLRRLVLECRIREDYSNSDRGERNLTLVAFLPQDPFEPVRLVERRHAHGPLVLEPDAVMLADDSALDFEDEDAARGIGDDEICFGEVSRHYADLDRVPGGPTGMQLRGERLIDLALGIWHKLGRARAGEHARGERAIRIQTGKPRAIFLPK